jgi:hypothetical protein
VKPGATAAARWYAEGFALGAAGESPTRRKGRPRIGRMVDHWRRGLVDGKFARTAFVGAYEAAIRLGAKLVGDQLTGGRP